MRAYCVTATHSSSVFYLEIIFPVQINHNHFRCSPSQFTIIPLLLLFALYPGTVSTHNNVLVLSSSVWAVRMLLVTVHTSSECQSYLAAVLDDWCKEWWRWQSWTRADYEKFMVFLFFSCKREAYNQKKQLRNHKIFLN